MNNPRMLLAVLAICLHSHGLASETVSGHFTAARACDSYQSYAKGTNPGAVRTQPGVVYEVQEVNKPGRYEWVRVEMPGATPALRWVARECGVLALDAEPAAGGGQAPQAGGAMCRTANQYDSYVLAVSWQAGFCEHGAHGKKPECEALDAGSLAVNNLTLHGLWPNRKECGTNYGNCGGKPLALSEETISAIAPWMPNFYYESSLGQHEWSKHGTCQGLGPDAYFEKAVAALKVVNASVLGQTVLQHVGGSFAVDQLFQDLRREYGDTVARSVMLQCSGQSYLQEIHIKLPREFTTDRGLAELVGNASGFASRSAGCGDQVRVEANGR